MDLSVTIQQAVTHHRAFELISRLHFIGGLVQQEIHSVITQPFPLFLPVFMTK